MGFCVFRHSGLDLESRGEEREVLWHPPFGSPWIPAFEGIDYCTCGVSLNALSNKPNSGDCERSVVVFGCQLSAFSTRLPTTISYMQGDTELEIASEARQPPGTEGCLLSPGDCRVACGSSQCPLQSIGSGHQGSSPLWGRERFGLATSQYSRLCRGIFNNTGGWRQNMNRPVRFVTLFRDDG